MKDKWGGLVFRGERRRGEGDPPVESLVPRVVVIQLKIMVIVSAVVAVAVAVDGDGGGTAIITLMRTSCPCQKK